MYNGLDIFATLHRLVRQALGGVSGALRGGLIVRAGERLIYRASVGYDTVAPGCLRVASDAGRVSPSPPFGPEAAPEAAVAMCAVPAAAWHRAHSPGATALHAPEPGGAGPFVLVVPFHMHGEPSGYFALEQATSELPAGERRAELELLAESAGSALERHGLYSSSARAAQEMRLLEEVLGAVAASLDLGKLVERVGHGIRNVQPGPRWSNVDLAFLDDEPQRAGAPGAGPRLRVYRAPRQPITAFWNNVREGVVNAGRDLQISVDFVVGSADGPGSQADLIEDAVRRGVHGIAIAPVDAVGIEPGIRRASEAGIPVVTIDSPAMAGSRAALYIGTDNAVAGRLAGEMMARLLPDGGAVATQLSSVLALNATQRLAAFASGVAGADITVGRPSENRFDPQLGLELAIAALEDEAGYVGALGICSENGPSWGQAAQALGRVGELKIVAFDLVTATSAMLREGVIHAAIVQREYDMGYRAVHTLHEMAARGAAAVLAELPASRFVDTGVDVVTLERTPWSIALADYLNLSAARKLASRRSSRGRAVDLLVIGMAEREVHAVVEHGEFQTDSLVGQVVDANRALVIDTAAPGYAGWSDVAAAHRDGIRTLVGIPLPVRSGGRGVLVLGSALEGACSPDDLDLLERIGAATAVALENARLLQDITERSTALERANVEQVGLLRTIAEMSSPVVPIARGVLVMPLVGTLDTQRSSRFMESLLEEITDHRARVVLIDVTGMAAMDAAAANHLAQAARAAGLLGAEVVLVGISPAAARLMVEQDLDLGGVVTHATLELGFVYALRKTNGRIVHARR